MCDCCKKIIVRNEIPVVGPTGPEGPEGPTGATGPQGPQGIPGTNADPLTSYLPITRTTISTMLAVDVLVTIPGPGDYAIQLEYYGQNSTGFTSLTTEVIKDLGAGVVLDTTNINFAHIVQPVLGPLEVVKGTYTHTAVLRGLSSSQEIGFRLSALGSPFTLENGSIVLTKITLTS